MKGPLRSEFQENFLKASRDERTVHKCIQKNVGLKANFFNKMHILRKLIFVFVIHEKLLPEKAFSVNERNAQKQFSQLKLHYTTFVYIIWKTLTFQISTLTRGEKIHGFANSLLLFRCTF